LGRDGERPVLPYDGGPKNCALLEALFRHKSGVFRAFMRVFVVLERGIFYCFQRLRRIFAGKLIFCGFREFLQAGRSYLLVKL
jgi:hypothetical protein